jgi:hypothetical protein
MAGKWNHGMIVVVEVPFARKSEPLELNNQCRGYSCVVKTVSSKRRGMGRECHLYLLSFVCQRTLQLPFAVCLARIRAHGWDPLVPTATGVYDGLQGAPRYRPHFLGVGPSH